MCNIKARREQGPVVNIIAVCSTDIAIDTMQFRLRFKDRTRSFGNFPACRTWK